MKRRLRGNFKLSYQGAYHIALSEFKKALTRERWGCEFNSSNQGLIAIFHGPRILPPEGREGVENTGLTGKIAFSPY